MTQPKRHADDGATVHTFADRFLVECPHCSRSARTAAVGKNGCLTVARFVCVHCGSNKDKEVRGWSVGVPVDSYFSLPLWLRTDCCGETLWAYNEEHLEYLRSYVAADHRMRNLDPDETTRNATMASRLPRWMIIAKNREEVLRCIDLLQQKIKT